MTPPENAAYEIGYRNGESSGYADWHFGLSEIAGVPDDVICQNLPDVCEWIAAHLVITTMPPMLRVPGRVL